MGKHKRRGSFERNSPPIYPRGRGTVSMPAAGPSLIEGIDRHGRRRLSKRLSATLHATRCATLAQSATLGKTQAGRHDFARDLSRRSQRTSNGDFSLTSMRIEDCSIEENSDSVGTIFVSFR